MIYHSRRESYFFPPTIACSRAKTGLLHAEGLGVIRRCGAGKSLLGSAPVLSLGGKGGMLAGPERIASGLGHSHWVSPVHHSFPHPTILLPSLPDPTPPLPHSPHLANLTVSAGPLFTTAMHRVLPTICECSAKYASRTGFIML